MNREFEIRHPEDDTQGHAAVILTLVPAGTEDDKEAVGLRRRFPQHPSADPK